MLPNVCKNRIAKEVTKARFSLECKCWWHNETGLFLALLLNFVSKVRGKVFSIRLCSRGAFISLLLWKQNPKSNPTQPQNNPPHSISCGPAPLGEFFPHGIEWESCSCLRSWTVVVCCAVHQLFWKSPCTLTSPFQSPVAWCWVMMCYSITNMSMEPAKQWLLCPARPHLQCGRKRSVWHLLQ